MEAAAGPRNEWRNVDYCSITIEGSGGLSDEIMNKRIEEVRRKRKEMENLEIEIRAQAIARLEISEVEKRFELKINEHLDAASNLKEQLKEREQHIHEIEMKLEEMDRELCAVKLDNEAAGAKDDLLREQNKELASFRSDRDNSEAERTQRMKQIHDLQEHIHEKERQILALEEQYRAAHKTILYKDERLREAQAWIARVQEMDVLQSTTMQAELRQRTELFNQYWIGIQGQFAEVERYHLQTIQQLQLDLAEVRERNGTYKEGAKVARQNSADSSSYVKNKETQTQTQINVNDVGATNGNLGLMSNGKVDGHPHASSSAASSMTEHAAAVTIVPSPILGMGGFIPPSQITALHPFVMHPQGVPQSLSSNSHNSQSIVGHFQPMSSISSPQHWEQAVTDVSQNSNQNNNHPSQMEHHLPRSDVHYSYELPAERKAIHPDHPNTRIDQQQGSGPPISGSSNKEKKMLESTGTQYQVSQEPQQTSNANASFYPSLGYASPEQKSEITVHDQITVSAINQSQEQLLASKQQWSAPNANVSAAPSHSMNSNNAADCSEKAIIFPESDSTGRTVNLVVPGPTMEPTLLDERSLLACIVHAIPAGADGQIRISTTLPNRLAKMLAPLHWHDYKKCYGKLDDFVACHPELFVIEGDFIHLREGAQEIILATTAFAKVSAAALSASHSSLFPSVALTPVAQSNCPRTVSTIDSRPPNNARDSSDKHSQIPKHNQQPNGVGYNIVNRLSDMNISVKPKILHEVNGLSSGIRPAHSSVQNVVRNGAKKGLMTNGRLSSGGKQQERSAGAGIIYRR